MFTFSVFFCQHRDPKTNQPPCGKFETFYDIPLNTYRKMFNESEQGIIKYLHEIHEENRAVEARENPSTQNAKQKETKSSKLSKKKSMDNYLHFFKLPAELRNQIVSEMDLNDFGLVADVAESKKDQSIAMFARGWISIRCVTEKPQNDSIRKMNFIHFRVFNIIDEWRQELLAITNSDEENEYAEEIIYYIIEVKNIDSTTTENVSPITETQKLVLLFKMIAAMVTVDIKKGIVDVMKSHAYYVLGQTDSIAYFTHLLT